MLNEKKIAFDSVMLNYAEGPDAGPPLVLLHGFPGRWQEFLPIIPALSLQYQIFALDYRGQGKSERTPGEYQSKYFGADVENFLHQLFDEPATIFGLSGSGLVALNVAANIPEAVQGVIVGDSPIDIKWLVGWMKSEPFQHLFSNFRELAGLNLSIQEMTKACAEIQVQVPGKDVPINYGETPGMDIVKIQQLALTLSYMDSGILEYHAEGRPEEFLEGFDFDEVLHNISCPVLILQGNNELGAMTTLDSVKHVQSIVPNTTHVHLKEVGHNLGLDTWQSAPLLRAVNSFLETLEG
jgi:pimeloyl-ACP methyl ester carboxylesterase